MRANLGTCLKLSTNNEGGYSNHPTDPGGPTNHGITQATLSAFIRRKASIADVKALTLDTSKLIYERNYWAPIWGDKLPSGLDYAVFDFGINSGPSRAIKELQKILPGVAPDGLMGQKTIAAIEAADVNALVKQLCVARIAYCRRLGTWATFGRGWTYRVMGTDPQGQYKGKPGVLGDALAMASRKPIRMADAVTETVPMAKARDTDIKITAPLGNKIQIGAIATGASSAILQFSSDYLPTFTDAAGMLEPYKDYAKVLGIVFVGIMVICAVLAIVVNIDKVRQSGTHA